MSHAELSLLVLDLIKMEIWYELGPHYDGGGQQMIFEYSREQLPEVLSSISEKIPRMAMTNGGDNHSLFSIRE